MAAAQPDPSVLRLPVLLLALAAQLKDNLAQRLPGTAQRLSFLHARLHPPKCKPPRSAPWSLRFCTPLRSLVGAPLLLRLGFEPAANGQLRRLLLGFGFWALLPWPALERVLDLVVSHLGTRYCLVQRLVQLL